MEITVTHINEYEKELLITVPWVMIEADYNDLLKKYAKFPFKGFRAGKAPVGAIESYFRNHIKNDLLAVASTRLCRKALKEKSMTAGSPIEITESELKKDQNLQFKANFIEMPQFELPDYQQLNLQSPEQDVKLDEISEKLLAQTDIALHPSFIENELKYSEIIAEDASDEEKNAAENRVKLMLILKKIADQDSIEVDEKDSDLRIKRIAAENDVTPEQLKEYLVINSGLTRLTDALLAETVLNYIIDIQN